MGRSASDRAGRCRDASRAPIAIRLPEGDGRNQASIVAAEPVREGLIGAGG
jgi:hypothetical protein